MGYQRSFLPREGFYIDPLAVATRKILLGPRKNVALLLFLRFYGASLRGVFLSDPPHRGTWPKLQSWLLACAVIGAILDVNDFLTRQFHNNWVKDSSWNWDRELVLITGGSSGIGATVAQLLCERNPNTRIVVVDYAPLSFTPPDRSKVVFYQCDLSQVSQVRNTCARIKKEAGDPTVVFNNAGLTRGRSVVEGAYEDVEVTLKVNLIAPFLILKEFLPAMVKHNHGHIVATSSMSSIITPANLADYGASKAGLEKLHETLALELADSGADRIRLSLVTLGFTHTPMFKGRTNQSHFLMPLLHVDSVGDVIIDTLYSTYGKNIYMPGGARYFTCIRSWPSWMQRILAEGTKGLQVDYKGRQRIDPKTGALERDM